MSSSTEQVQPAPLPPIDSADYASRKRKRMQPTVTKHAKEVTQLPTITPETSFSSSIEDQTPVSTPPNRLIENLSDTEGRGGRIHGSASPRMVAAGQLERLSIAGRIRDTLEDEEELEGGIRGRSKLDKSLELRERDGVSILADDEGDGNDDGEEDARVSKKRIPRGIRSPRPSLRRFSLPVGSPPDSRVEDMETKTSPLAKSPKSPSSKDSGLTTIIGESTASIWDFDFTSMTWQDSEITGHLMLDSDDDGTGINGIGFKPTPSIARQRAAQRRRQVQEWKMRQETEERERRAERRRLQQQVQAATVGYAGNSGLGDGAKKIVRFAV